MDVRSSKNPVVAGARDALDRFNQRHPWSHNDHFHGWILRHLPARRRSALDVGCGTGLLVERLAGSFERVTGIDRDAGMVAAAAARLSGRPGAGIRHCRFDDVVPPPGGYDLVTMVAVLHHLDLDATLARMAALLAPGGRFLVVGLARVSGPADLTFDLASAVLNPVVGMVKHPRRADQDPSAGPRMPVRDPVHTVAEVARTARRHLPGVLVQRRLWFRYTASWTRPATITGTGPGAEPDVSPVLP